MFFPYVAGISAGACNAASYISRQNGRNKKVMIDLVGYPSYISYKKCYERKNFFGWILLLMKFPTVPFDYGTFYQRLRNTKDLLKQ
ncbi:hypothetical protein BKP37_07100 [Anaerobacillus alkalilacustris]|uniref:PNPLA domain-containing protein n=1 Tax=Anaerobacillus alkalilacustris TaxID=393763 RepID=A0A1S2LRA7_9BACI|nr:hypothetical protein BKP37_07100 [Anaerobacillus alkalilacustris]